MGLQAPPADGREAAGTCLVLLTQTQTGCPVPPTLLMPHAWCAVAMAGGPIGVVQEVHMRRACSPDDTCGAAAQLCQAAEEDLCMRAGLDSSEQGGVAEPAAKKPRRLTKRVAAQPEARPKRKASGRASKTAEALVALASQRSSRARQAPRALESFQGGSASE